MAHTPTACGSLNISLNPVHPPFPLPGENGNKLYGFPEGFEITNATEASIAASSSAAQYATTATVAATKASTLRRRGSAAVPKSPDYVRTSAVPGTRNVTYPPYVLHNLPGGDINVHTASTNATHFDGTQEYDWHNLFGHQILNATYHALLAVNATARPFIIGRSTFAGSGTVAGHWGGDNVALWAFQQFSIPQALSFSLFGIPMFGVDTCGEILSLPRKMGESDAYGDTRLQWQYRRRAL